MGAGGIVQNRAAVLVTAMSDESFGGALCDTDKAAFQAIADTAPDQRTPDQLKWLAHKISQLCSS